MTGLTQIPIGWVETTLGQLLEPSKQKSDPTKEKESNYIGLEHIEKDTGKVLRYGTSKEVRSQKNRFHSGDLLYGRLRPYLNKVYLPEFDGVCSTDIIVFPRNHWLSSKFMKYRLLNIDFVRYANQNMSGVQHPRIDFQTLGRFKLYLPPLPEQHRIADKIEELFSFLDAGGASLQVVQAQLKRYRQVVLKAAFEGKLTEQWRLAHKDKIEPATKLIDIIKEERKKKLQAQYKERPLVELDRLPKLPDGWVWTNCANLSWLVTSGSRDWKKYYSNEGPIFIRTQNINTNKLNLEDIAHVRIPIKTEGKRSLVERNDILTIITGANVGKVALVDRDIGEAYVSQSVALIKLAVPEIGQFIQLSMITDGFGKTHLSKMVYGMGRPVLSLENIRDLLVPLAPLAEQQQIVNGIKQSFFKLDEVEGVVENNLRNSEIMRQSVLKVAFEGKLVPQNPSDEPADKLLERIKAEHLSNKSKNNQVELSQYVK